jgi:ATP-dependent protease ClpP protease subunit
MRDRFETVCGYATFIIIVWTIIAFISSFAHTAPRKPVIGIHKLYGAIDQNTYVDFKDAVQRAEKAGLGELKVHIDSPGGWLDPAEAVIRLMDKSKLRFKCTVDNMAASAAFLIFVNCDDRLAKKTSRLMWHQIRTSIPVPVDSFMLRYFVDEMEESMYYYALMISLNSDYTVEEIQHNVRYIDW